MRGDERLHVVAAAIVCDKRVFLARRHADAHCGGLWEFPGGKVENGESPREAIVRELGEEIGIRATGLRQLIRIPHDYDDRKVLLDVWQVHDWEGEAHGAEGQEVAWVEVKKLKPEDFPAANAPILKAVQLPCAYLITPEPREEHYWGLRTLHQCLKNGVRLVQLRAKEVERKRFKPLVIQYAALCKSYGAKLLINAEVEMVTDVGIEGVHLNSSQLSRFESRPLNHLYVVGASCHDEHELARAVAIGADFAVLSPVKPTPSHPEVTSFGWERFSELVADCPIPVYGLGGLGMADLNDAWHAGAQGVAGISQLWAHYGANHSKES